MLDAFPERPKAHLEQPSEDRGGVSGCEGPSTQWTHFQADQPWGGGGVDVPGCEGLQG